MATSKSKSDNEHIKAQQAGRRLSGNQQRELTQEQTAHPERVEAAEEKMKKDEQRRDKKTKE